MPNKRKICTENLNVRKCLLYLINLNFSQPLFFSTKFKSNQSVYIASLNSYYPPESVINSAYRKVLDFKENAEKILEKEKSETLCLNDFSKAILDCGSHFFNVIYSSQDANAVCLFILARSFEISLQHNCIKLKCYITLEKDKDAKKKRNEQQLQQQQQQTPPGTPVSSNSSSIFGHGNLCDSPFDSVNKNLPNSSTNGSISTSGGAKKVNVEVIMKSNPFRVGEFGFKFCLFGVFIYLNWFI